jgi:hypothetical protein
MHLSIVEAPINGICVKTIQMSRLMEYVDSLLITIYQEVNDLLRSNTCCDDEIERTAEKSAVCQSNIFVKLNENNYVKDTHSLSITVYF